MFPSLTELDFQQAYHAPSASLGDIGHRIGQLGRTPDGSLWRLFKAGADITNPLLLPGCYDQPTDCTAQITAVGSETLKVTETTCAKDLYKDGSIIIGGAATAALRRFYHIGGNTKSDDTYTTLSLHHPLVSALVATAWATMWPNRFRDVRPLNAAGGFMSAVCYPMQTVTATYYAWGLVRGPCFGTVSSTIPGAAANDRLIVVQGSDGALIMADESWGKGTPDSQQIAGYLIPRTGGTYACGDQHFMLQLE